MTQQNTQYGHQFNGHVIRIVGIEAFHAAQLIVDFLRRPFGGVKPDMAWYLLSYDVPQNLYASREL